jgi:SAM-dependent methyltransferase
MEKPENLQGGSSQREIPSFAENSEKLKSLLEGSHVYSDDQQFDAEAAWKEWVKERKFIASAIDKDGSLLDFGSANGLLLKSLEQWSERKIDPYGLDIDIRAIQEAKELFPQQESHFATPEELKSRKDFPRTFDFIYWNVWDNHVLKADDEILSKLKSEVKNGGRLILGFYDTKDKNNAKIQNLMNAGSQPSYLMENPDGGDQVIAWFDFGRDRGASEGAEK